MIKKSHSIFIDMQNKFHSPNQNFKISNFINKDTNVFADNGIPESSTSSQVLSVHNHNRSRLELRYIKKKI